MCIQIKNPHQLHPRELIKKASKDIIAYKAVITVDGIFRSLPQMYPYELGKLIKVKEIFFDPSQLRYDTLQMFNGLHSSNKPWFPGCTNLLCIIPKGSLYFEGRSGYLSYELLPKSVHSSKEIKPFVDNCWKDFKRLINTWNNPPKNFENVYEKVQNILEFIP